MQPYTIPETESHSPRESHIRLKKFEREVELEEEIKYIHIGNVDPNDLANPAKIVNFYSGSGNPLEYKVGRQIDHQGRIKEELGGLYAPVKASEIVNCEIACTYDSNSENATLDLVLENIGVKNTVEDIPTLGLYHNIAKARQVQNGIKSVETQQAKSGIESYLRAA